MLRFERFYCWWALFGDGEGRFSSSGSWSLSIFKHSLSLSSSRLLLLSRSAHDGRHISYVSAPTETETTHTGHERVSVDLKSAKIKGSASASRRVPHRSEGLRFEYTEKNGGV